MFVHPPDPLNTTIEPAVPTFTFTAFGITAPATKFRFDAVGRLSPFGNTVTYPPAVGCTAVTFSATAAASTGTPPTFVTAIVRAVFAGIHPPLLRVSTTRNGVTPANPPSAAAGVPAA
jgi:hypothetical protein